MSSWCGSSTPAPASKASRSAFVIACPVRSPTWRSRCRVAPPQRASRYPPFERVNSTPSLLEPVDRGRSLARQHLDELGFAVSCELRMTSSAWISGESSSPNAAWIPPWAFAELHACSVVFVASADAGAGALGGNGGRETRRAAADHEHVEGGAGSHDRNATRSAYLCHYNALSERPAIDRSVRAIHSARWAPWPRSSSRTSSPWRRRTRSARSRSG